MAKDSSSEPQDHTGLGAGLAIGVGLGTALGLTMLDNVTLGIPIGMGLGLAIGSAYDHRRAKAAKRKTGDDGSPRQKDPT